MTNQSIDQLIPADKALETVLYGVEPIVHETIDLTAAGNRILAADLQARRTQPPFDASAMDGYAVRQEDLGNLPVSLKVVGQSRAGVPFQGDCPSDSAVRIFTGAVLPKGADSIIIQENITAEGDMVVINHGVDKGRFVRKAGLDFKTGETLLRAGDRMTAFRLALAASMDFAEIPVFRKPGIALLSTGDELVMPGKATGPGQIIASNTFGLAASIKNTGGNLIDKGLIADTSNALISSFNEAISEGADVIVTTGGASIGDHDLVLPAAQSIGFRFEIAKIAMRPGKPFLFGKLRRNHRTIYLTGLAGNPVSSLVAFNVFTKPLIQTLAGQSPEMISMQTAILGRDLPENDERAEYMRAVTTTGENGELIATPFDRQDSSMLANLVRADCLLYRPVNAPSASEGSTCQIVLIE